MKNIEKRIKVKLKNYYPYVYDICTIKDYGGRLKLTHFNALRQAGVEYSANYSAKGSVSDEKSNHNICRAKSRIFELAMCNEWEYFITITLNPAFYDRGDLNKFRKDFVRFLNDTYRKKGFDVKYLLIPEEHTNGGWHMHGFIKGLPQEELRAFTLEEKLPKHIINKLKNGELVYDWSRYRKKFGFNDCEPIRNRKACSAYVTKYITKDLSRTVKESGAHLYYCSQGLSRAKEIKRGYLSKDIHWDFENEYYSVKWLDGFTEEEIKNLIYSNDNIDFMNFQAVEFNPNCDTDTGEILPTPFD